ncbi:MAG: 3-phosphoshikimate 1-carboxyvinyltransferase [Oscillospiraceae bacterium]|nr:3-phosphoshikimate 1-carboxyvinyltransferase [Oscillospiraceae bacterium]
MKATIYPSPLSGDIPAIASKSQAHRLLICAALADRETTIACPTLSADITATAGCLQALGADIAYAGGVFTVRPIRTPAAHPVLDCGESGSTLRFLLPVVCALGTDAELCMGGRLPDRPLSPLWEELERHGAVLAKPCRERIAVSGRLTGGDYTLDAGISSQFISGLLFALPLLAGESRIGLTGTLESAAYLDMTVRAQALFGIESVCENGGYTLPAGQRYISPGTANVEGDWSNGAFWIAADRIMGGTLNITGLDPSSPQGDRAAEALALRIAAGSAVIDCRDVPDLVPVLSVLAAVSPGETRFINAGRLRIKESDRLQTTAALLSALGADVQELPEGLVVRGKAHLTGGEVDSANDHRIAMSAAVAAIACTEPVILHGAQAVNKSYPAFWADYQRLGGHVTLEDEP